MASVANKEEHGGDLSSEYEKQRLSFIADLRRFNDNRGTPFDRIPEIDGREVDLYHLYQRVTGLGGRHKVNNEQLWEDIQEEFSLPKGCVNSTQALKNIYFRYLNLYEKVNHLGEDPDQKNSEEEEGPARKKICLPIETIPLFYNYNQHKLTDALRQQHSLSTDMYKQGEYENLMMSLRSGLPNEVDFAVNVCMLLSTEGKHCIKLERAPQLLRLLLAHIGVFDEEANEMQDLYQYCWEPCTSRNFLRFWYETVDRADIRTLITWRGRQYVQRELVGSEVLNLGRDIGTLDVEGQRVLQIAIFLHNLSFEEANQKILASSYIVYKFLMLSLHSGYGNVRQLALDTFANLSCEFALDAVEGTSSHLVLDILNNALFSEDRFFLVRGLEILSKMSQLSCNESMLLEHLKEDVYKRLVALLTVQDIQLIVHTLEALYKLSKVGEPFTTRIARVHRAIDTLVSLITIEAQSFGPGSLVGIKVVEYVPPAHVSTDDGESLKRSTTVIQPINPDSVNIYQVPANSQSQLSVVPDTGGGKGPGGGGDVSAKLAALDKEQITDIQATTSNWLNATYELKKKSKVNQVELFSDYLQFCRKFGINNAMSSAEFLHLVKVIFHQCEVLSINRKNGDRDVYLEGLCKRAAQKPFAVTTLPPEKVRNPVCVNVKQTQCQVLDSLAHTPTLRQRLMEPPRVSLHPQLPHTGASSSLSSSSSSPAQGASKNKSQQNTPVGPGRAGLHSKILKNNKTQLLVAVKRTQGVANSSCDGLSTLPTTANQGVPSSAHKAQMLASQGLNSGTAQSFPSITQALQSEQAGRIEATDLQSVKSLLARKLSHIAPDQDLSGPQSSYLSGTIQSNQLPNSISAFSSQSHSTTFSTASTLGISSSSQATLHQPTHPHHQTASCIMSSSSSSSTILAPSMSVLSPLNVVSNATSTEQISQNPPQNSISFVPAAQTNSSLNQLSIGPSAVQSSLSNNTLLQQGAHMNTAIITQHNNSMSPLQNSVLSIIQRNTHQYMQNAQISVVQRANGSQGSDVAVVPAQQGSVGMHLMELSSASMPQNSVAVVQQQNCSAQQGSSSIPCAILPKMASVDHHQQGSPLSVGAFPCLSSTSSLSSSSQLAVNHSNRNPSTVLVANQACRTLNNSNTVTLTTAVSAAGQATTATQAISSPAVAALLTTSSHPASHMIISTPVIAGQVQRPQSIPGQAATTVVIQTPPGTIVMPSRQVVVQANGSTTFGSIQQGTQGGTVSFIVPSQYRQGQSVTVQGLNFIQQQGTVNMVPSLTLANTAAQSQTQSIIQAAQTQQNLIQVAQNPQNLVHTGAVSRQIVLAPNQTKNVPVGVQISSLPGSFVRNASNICITPQDQQQQQQSVLIQSSAIQQLPQAMNISQSQPAITSVQIPLQAADPQALRSDLHMNPSHQQQQSQQQIVAQTFQPLVVIDSQTQQSMLPSQCNGLSHIVNGILGSPESVGSDFPPSPLSIGVASDKDVPNGRVTDLDRDGLVEKSDISKIMEKTKLNGYIHSFDSNNSDVRPLQTDSQGFRLSAEAQGVIVNGCASGVIQQSSNSVAHRVNIPGSQGGGGGGTVIQLQGQNQLGSQQQQVVISSGGRQQNVVAFVQQQQFQPQQQVHLQVQQQQQHVQSQQQVLQQQHHHQVQIHAQPSQQVFHQKQLPRFQQLGTTSSQQLGAVQQLRPRISTLPCTTAAVRPVLSWDISRDSDASNDSVPDGDRPSQLANGHFTQVTSIAATPKSKPKTKKLEMPPVSDKLPRAPGKKRPSMEEVGNATQAGAHDHSHKTVQIAMEYMCEWANCRRRFSSTRLVFLHVFKTHLPKSAESSCQWVSCEKLVRKRWSLVSHIQDHHCSESAMRVACQRRYVTAQQQSSGSSLAAPPTPHQPMIYPPDAAMQAIRRFSIKHPYQEFADQREGPVSKHIRLTAALILRNICHFSSLGRRLIRRHEQELSYNTMNAVEASTALSHCLWEIMECCEQKLSPVKL